MKIELTYTQNDRLVMTVDYKDITKMMEIELTYTQNNRPVTTVVGSAKAIEGGNRGRDERIKIDLAETQGKKDCRDGSLLCNTQRQEGGLQGQNWGDENRTDLHSERQISHDSRLQGHN